MNTKKIFAFLTVMALLFSCAAFAEGETDSLDIGNYTIYNKTGETVTEVKITDNVTGEAIVFPYDGVGSLENDGMMTMTIEIPKDENGSSHELTLSFKTESGREEAFGTLHIEDVVIDLLAADAMTVATPINFRKQEEYQTGTYTFYNKTGETVLFINLIENGEEPVTMLRYKFDDGLAPDAEITLSFSVSADKKDVSMTLQFVTESGKIGTFSTLHIEEVPITLLDVDAVSGATQISFTAPSQP